jgi:hypothetical protein
LSAAVAALFARIEEAGRNRGPLTETEVATIAAALDAAANIIERS